MTIRRRPTFDPQLEVWRFEPELDGYRERLESSIDELHPRIPDQVFLYDLHV